MQELTDTSYPFLRSAMFLDVWHPQKLCTAKTDETYANRHISAYPIIMQFNTIIASMKTLISDNNSEYGHRDRGFDSTTYE